MKDVIKIFAAGFVLGGAFMASPAVGVLLMVIGLVYIGATHLKSKKV